MKRELKQIILLYFIFVIVKLIISYFIPSSRAFSDDYRYLEMAQSFFYNFNLNVHDLPNIAYQPLYSIVISVSYLFTDFYLAIKVINSLISSLIIFPSYFLAREFLKKKQALFITIFIALLPSNLNLISYIMSENLFYPLFLFSIYFIYKSFKNNEVKDYIFSAIFILLASLTRVHGLILIVLVGILFFFNKTNKIKLAYKLVLLLAAIGLSIFILSSFGLFDLYAKEASILLNYKNRFYPLIIWLFNYLGFVFLASGFVFMPLALLSFKIKDSRLDLFRKISLITLILTLIIAANHHLRSPRYIYQINDLIFLAGRPIGRYVDFILPLIIILGFIALSYYLKNKENLNKILKKSTIILTFVMLIATHLITRPLVPYNNISLTLFGTLKYVIDLIFYSKTSFDDSFTLASFVIISLVFVSIPFISFYVLRKFNYKKIISLLLIFVLISSLISLGVVYYGSKTSWYYNSEQRQLALYLNKIDKERNNILIDERDHGDLGGETYDPKALWTGTNESKYTILGYWLNDELIIGDVNKIKADYIISTHDLDFEKLYKTSNDIYLYKVD